MLLIIDSYPNPLFAYPVVDFMRTRFPIATLYLAPSSAAIRLSVPTVVVSFSSVTCDVLMPSCPSTPSAPGGPSGPIKWSHDGCVGAVCVLVPPPVPFEVGVDAVFIIVPSAK